jgi:hypothetical protein
MLIFRILFITLLLSNIAFYSYSKKNTPKQRKFIAVDNSVNKLTLLSELDTSKSIWEESQPKSSNSSSEVFNQECYTIGVFNSKSESATILNALKKEVLKIRTRKIISSQEAGYWVYIPAKNSRNEALDIGRKLSGLKIKDYYVVTGGENENTISLGLYRDVNNADSRLQELQSKGFDAKKQIKIEQWPEFWIDYSIASDQVYNLTDVTQINPKISSNKVECNW